MIVASFCNAKHETRAASRHLAPPATIDPKPSLIKSFAEPTFSLYQALPAVESADVPSSRPSINDLVPKERRIQQLVSRKAVLSFQRNLTQSNDGSVSVRICYRDQLANFSSKFSQRARGIALETARVTYLEAYPLSSESSKAHPKSYSSNPCLDAIIPFKLTDFPSYSMKPRRRVTVEDSLDTNPTKRQKTYP